ncbi:hypothetical protein [Enterococcus sp. UD-01]|jgi:hypothetical protein|uniref:hypothetical protein n=1 Tax=Enterococcus sp. UD-01 TaxID=3373911 RepID=UPI003837D798
MKRIGESLSNAEEGKQPSNTSIETAEKLTVDKRLNEVSATADTLFYKFTAPKAANYYFIDNNDAISIVDEKEQNLARIEPNTEAPRTLAKGETIYLKGSATAFQKFMLASFYQLKIAIDNEEPYIYEGTSQKLTIYTTAGEAPALADVTLTIDEQKLKIDEKGNISRNNYSGQAEIKAAYKEQEAQLIVYVLREGEPVSFEKAQELSLNQRISSQYDNEFQNYFKFTAPKAGKYYPVGGENQLKYTKKQTDKLTLVSELKDGLTLAAGEEIFFSGQSFDFSGFMLTDTPEEITVSGYALDTKTQPLANQTFTLSLANQTNEKITTDQSGYFFTHLIKGKTYELRGEQLMLTLTAKNQTDIEVKAQKGQLKLGRTITEEKGKEQLKSSTIYLAATDFEPVTDTNDKLTLLKNLNIQEGDVLVLPESEAYPKGAAVKVLAFEDVQNKTIVRIETPKIHEVIDVISGDTETLDIAKGTFIPAEGVNLKNTRQKRSLISSSLSISTDLKDGTDFESKFSIKFTGSIDIKKLHINYTGIGKPTDIQIETKLKEECEVSIATKSEKLKMEKEYPLGKIAIPTNVPGVTVTIPLTAVLTVEGKVELSLTQSCSLGLAISFGEDTSVKPTKSFDLKPANFNMEASASAGIKADVAIEVLTMSLAEIGAEAGSGITVSTDFGIGEKLKLKFDTFMYLKGTYELPGIRMLNRDWSRKQTIFNLKQTIYENEKEIDSVSMYGNKDYVLGMTQSKIKGNNADINLSDYEFTRLQNDFYVIEKTEEGNYQRSSYLHLIRSDKTLKLACGGRYIKLRPEFAKYYEEVNYHPWAGKDANYIMRWVNYWSTSEFTLAKSSNISEDVFLLSRGDAKIEHSSEKEAVYNIITKEKEVARYGNKDYVLGMTQSKIKGNNADINLSDYEFTRLQNDFYVIEKTEEGNYQRSSYLHLIRSDKTLKLACGGRYIKLRPEFAKYYEEVNYHPWAGKDANYIMRWVNYWSTSEFTLAKSSNISEDVFLLSRGDAKIEHSSEKEAVYNIITKEKEVARYGNRDYVLGMTQSKIKGNNADINLSDYNFTRLQNDFYVIEKTEEGDYQRSSYLQLIRADKTLKLACGGRYIKLRPEFAKYYEEVSYHPWEGKDANYIMRWLNYWSTSEFFFIYSTNITKDLNRLNGIS